MEQKVRFYNNVQIVLIETGELITKSQFERMNLRIIKKSKTYEQGEDKFGKYCNVTITWECKQHEQQRLFD